MGKHEKTSLQQELTKHVLAEHYCCAIPLVRADMLGRILPRVARFFLVWHFLELYLRGFALDGVKQGDD